VQVDQLAQVRQPDAFAVPRDLFEDAKARPSDWTPTRCRSSASSSMSLAAVAPAWRRRSCAARRFLTGPFAWYAISQIKSPRDGDELYQASQRLNSAIRRATPRSEWDTAATGQLA